LIELFSHIIMAGSKLMAALECARNETLLGWWHHDELSTSSSWLGEGLSWCPPTL